MYNSFKIARFNRRVGVTPTPPTPPTPLIGYFVSNTGDDNADGLTEATAWETLSKVAATTLIAGDNVYLERDSVFRESYVFAQSGASGSPITFDSYGDGGLPVIDGADVINGLTDEGSNIWQKTGITTQPNMMWLDGVSGELQTSIAACTEEGDWFWAANILSVYSAADPSGDVEIAQRSNIINLVANDYVTLMNLTVQHANGTGVRGNGAENISINQCTVQQNYGMGIYLSNAANSSFDGNTIVYNGLNNEGHGFYALSTLTGQSNLTFTNNVTNNNGWDNVRFKTLTTTGQTRMSDITIYGNSFDYAGSAGLYLQMVDSVIVYNNTFDNNGASTSPTYDEDYGVGVQSCSELDIYNNTFTNQKGNNSIIEIFADELAENGEAHNIRIFRNIFSGATAKGITTSGSGQYSRSGIEIFSNTFTGIIDNVFRLGGVDDGVHDVIKIYNNSVYGNSGRIMYSLADNTVLVQNNIFYEYVNYVLTHLGQVDGLLVTSNNLYGGAYAGNIINYKSTTYDLSEITNFEPTAQTGDPLFTDAANGDLSLQSGSPAINNGVDVGLTEDILGNPIPSGGGYDIGAYEKQ